MKESHERRKGIGEERRRQLEVVRKRVGTLVKTGESVLVVGKGDRRGSAPLRKSLMSGDAIPGLRVTEGWINGRLTNHAGFRAYVARQAGRRLSAASTVSTASTRWYDQHRKGREGWLGDSKARRPGLVVLLDAVSQGEARREAQRCGIPTVGRVPEGVLVDGRTYPRFPLGSLRGLVGSQEGRLFLGRRRKRARTAPMHN